MSGFDVSTANPRHSRRRHTPMLRDRGQPDIQLQGQHPPIFQRLEPQLTAISRNLPARRPLRHRTAISTTNGQNPIVARLTRQPAVPPDGSSHRQVPSAQHPPFGVDNEFG
jgi:hypothetical protein